MRIDIDFLFAQLIIRVLRELEVHIYVKVLCIYADVSPTGSELMIYTTSMIVSSLSEWQRESKDLWFSGLQFHLVR